MNPLYSSLPTTIFEIMSGLARETGAVNLGQGFPDVDGPLDIRRRAAQALIDGPNQYPPMRGLPALREAIAAHYARFYGLSFDPATEVLVTSGATEAIAASLLALIAPGDEVALFEPLYDAYLPLVARAGGIARPIPLSPPDWRIDDAVIAKAFGPRTRLAILNNPMNPSGAMFRQADLARLAAACIERDIIVVCDEVWEHVIFDGAAHSPLIALPGMRERVVKIGSAGKIFAMTGWKVGLVCGAPPLIEIIAKAHQFLTFTTPPNLQVAVAYGLGKPDDYFLSMRADLARSRDRLVEGLKANGFTPLPSQATFFLNVDLAASGISLPDEAFCLRAVREAGVAAIPISSFFAKDAPRNLIRLCFCKQDDVLDEGVARLAKARRLLA